MIKIPCLFKRDFTDKRNPVLLPTVTPGCEWVLAGEGIATRKYDGTACAIINGEVYKRYDAKQGKDPPIGAIPCSEPDPVTGHWPHWVKVDPRKAEDRYYAEVWQKLVVVQGHDLDDGTYELCGPKIGSNAEGFGEHGIIQHGRHELFDVPRTFDGLREYLGGNLIEGIVFHHPDGHMCKIRRHDFGWPW
jgi:hypothetical protein